MGVGVVADRVLTMVNLRGVRESRASIFAAPTYVYLVGVFGLLGFGLFRFATGDDAALRRRPRLARGGGRRSRSASC